MSAQVGTKSELPRTSDLERIARSLEASPTAAYTAAHDYPNAAPLFESSPGAERERVDSEQLRLYVHIPFCNYACAFCCYAKQVGVELAQKQRYVKALERELEWVEPGTPVSQFFIGGGTPTALPPELLDEVLGAIVARMPFYGDDVHTVEASPESLTDAHLQVLAARGVGRVSMGVQSLQGRVLDAVRRAHSEQSAIEACGRVLDSGRILNIDLIYGLPEQTEDSYHRDFAMAAQLGVHSVTAYNLRLNEYTPLTKLMPGGNRFGLAGLMRWRAFVRDTAAEFGYTQTRWHTFKRMDTIAARHERVRCSGDDMRGFQLGIGMSARSSLGYTVYRNHKGLNSYMQRIEAGISPVEEIFPLDAEDLRTQFVARTLGDGHALPLADYQKTFGTTLAEDFGPTLERLFDGGLIDGDDTRVTLTASGELLYDLVTLAFYPARAKRWLNDRMKGFQLAAVA